MPSNSDIRTIHFAQGVDITLPAGVLDDSSDKVVLNNASNASTGLTFDRATYQEVIIDYAIRRRTDSVAERWTRGRMRLIASQDAVLDANKWALEFDFEADRPSGSPEVTFSIVVTAGVVDLQYSSTNWAGANHQSNFYYKLTTFLV